MSPSVSIPPGLALPGPWGLVECLLLVTFAAHLLVMNAALGGLVIALATPGPRRNAAVSLAGRLPVAVAITVNLGIPALLFASVLYGQYLYTAAILSAVSWLSLFLVVMLAYALLYVWQPRAALPGATGLAVLAALLLLAASLILVNVSTLALRPEASTAYFDRPDGTILNFDDPMFFPRWLHFVTASLAVGGLFLALVNRKGAAHGDALAISRTRLGLSWLSRATMVQFLVGLWFFLSLPENVRLLFLGGDGLSTVVFVLGLGLAGASLIQGLRGATGRTAILVAATVLAMAGVRELVRRSLLAPDFRPESLPVLPQYGPFIMFLGAVAAVGCTVAWIIVVWRRAGGRD